MLINLYSSTDPPQLSPNHPIRRAFQRLGTEVARHWLLSIVVSVAAGVSICYPSVFLYSHPAAGFNRIPHHVWASAKQFDSTAAIRPDVEVRQVWVHGDYMRALDRDVLQGALTIQNELIGGGLDTTDGAGNAVKAVDPQESEGLAPGFTACGYHLTQPLTWGFHSPLMHWNCSAEAIETDEDLLSTINEQSARKSYMNLTLRPSSVFAGKSFVKSNVTAADALVVTLFDLTGSNAGSEWDRRLHELADASPPLAHWYLPEGGSQLYEFEFKRMSWNDGLLLFLSYTAMAIYVLASLRKTRAVKSTLGLGVAIVTELTVSVVASFTICGVLNIDLTRIPREAYPFVVLTIGLENMFRLTNEVVSTPATMPPIQRISQSLGNVGHLSFAVALQNLAILWLLSKVVAPSVRSFCAFAAVALAFDYLFHLIFFVAVLSVDVQRLELQDSLDKFNMSRRAKSPRRSERRTWTEALKRGRLPFSTRVAGTAVSVTFVLGLNWHFFDNMTLLQMLRTLRFATAAQQSGFVFASSTLPPINQRRTPAAWMRIQDHKTAEEVIGFVNPQAPSFVARIHQPVAVVLSGSNRSGIPTRSDAIYAVIRDVLDEHLIPWSFTVVLIVALVTILMNYLLWNELSEEETSTDGGDFEQQDTLQFGRLYRCHEYDIMKMFANGRNLVTISSDSAIALQLWDSTKGNYRTCLVKSEYLATPLGVIVSIALNDPPTWLAMLSKDGSIAACKTSTRRLKTVSSPQPQERMPVLFSFVPASGADTETVQLIMVLSDGRVTEVILGESLASSTTQVVEDVITHACMLPENKRPLRLVMATKTEGIKVITKAGDLWTCDPLQTELGNADDFVEVSAVKAVVRIPLLGLFVIASSSTIQFFDSSSLMSVGSISVNQPIKRGTLKVMHSPRRDCPTCRATAAHSIAIAYSDASNDDCVMHAYGFPGDAPSLICFASAGSQASTSCAGITEASHATHLVSSPGSWDITGVQSVIGIRRIATTRESEGKAGSSATDIPSFAQRAAKIRPRRQSRSNHRTLPSSRSPSTEAFEDYEVWTMSSLGDLYTQVLLPTAIRSCHSTARTGTVGQQEHEQLYAASTGPLRKLGKRSVAVAVANTVLSITLGAEGRWEDGGVEEDYTALNRGDVGWRRSREKARRRDD